MRGARRRAICVALTATVLVAAGCGDGDGGATADKAYYASLNAFCSTVAVAAGHVTSVTTRLRTHPPSARAQIFQDIATTLEGYASAMDRALAQLKATKVPSRYSTFNSQATAAFATLASRLHHAATGARSGDAKVLSGLGATLEAVKGPPNQPKDITSNVKACQAASF